MNSNITKLASELKNGAVGGKKNSKKKQATNSKPKIKKINKHAKKVIDDKHKKVFGIKKLHHSSAKEKQSKAVKHVAHSTKHITSSIRDINKDVKSVYKIDDKSDLKNQFHDYLVTPDLFKYYQMNSKADNLEQLDKKSAILQIMTHSHHKFSSNNQLLSNTKIIHLQIPNYINKSLNVLVKMIKNIKVNQARYPSLEKLYEVMNNSRVGFNVNKSTVLTLLIMGLFKPDAKVQKVLMSSIKAVDKDLISTGYLTPLVTKYQKYTTVSVPSNLGVWLNLAESFIMASCLDKYDFNSNDQFKTLEKSASTKYGIDGGIMFDVNNYLSSFTNIINFKLQKVLFLN